MNGSIVETRKKSEYSEREGEERQRESTEIITTRSHTRGAYNTV